MRVKNTYLPSIRICKVSNLVRLALCVAFFAIIARVDAQEVKVNGGFLSDSLKIGEKTAFFLAAHYPSSETVVFPDSTFRYFPFEWNDKKYFPTISKNGTSIDSAVYYLSSFEVDRVQYLNLPVYIVQPKDCTAIQSLRDSVLIVQQVATIPDSIPVDKLPLKMNTAFETVPYQFNFWILIFVVAGLIIAAVLVWVIYGKKIRRYFITRRLKRKHFQFQTSYNAIVEQLTREFSPPKTESALSTWKKYMEQLESRPFTSLTTRETLQVIPDESLATNLSKIDSAVYGNNTTVMDSLQHLRSFADERFAKKLNEVNHG
jgi:hypothetical protein